MKKLIIIYNWKAKKNESFPAYLEKMGYSYEIIDNSDDGARRFWKWYKIINSLECVGLALQALRRANKDDLIISMCATPGILASICNYKHKKILVLNLLCHSSKKSRYIEKIRNQLYSHALNKKNVWATCNAQEDVEKYKNLFSIRQGEHIFHLPDGIEIDNKSLLSTNNEICSNDIFSCGASARDWKTLVQVAKKRPDLHFYVIARECDWNDSYNLDNITVEFNVP